MSVSQDLLHLATQAAPTLAAQPNRLARGFNWIKGATKAVAHAPVALVAKTAQVAKDATVGAYHYAESAVAATYHLGERAVVGTYHLGERAVVASYNAGAAVLATAAEKTKAAAATAWDFLGSDFQLVGYNVNPLTKLNRVGLSRSEDELNAQLEDLDTQLTGALDVDANDTDVSVTSAPSTKTLDTHLENEKKAKENLSKHVIEFSIISTLESLFGTAKIDLLSFYGKLSKEPNPLDAYVKQVSQQNRFYGLVAAIAMPILKFFTSILMGSLPQTFDHLSQFLSDKDAVKNFLITFLKATTAYMKSVKTNPSREDQRKAYDALNQTLFNALKVHTGRSISDEALNKFLGFILNKLDLLKWTMDVMVTPQGDLDPTTSYNLLDLVDSGLKRAATGLNTPAAAATFIPGTLQAESPLADRVFDKEEKETIETAISSLMGYLLKGQTMGRIEKLIQPQVEATAKQAVLNGLAQVIEMLGNEEKNAEMRSKLFSYIDTSITTDYSSSPIKSAQEVKQKRQEVEKHLNEVIDLSLDQQFANEMMDQGRLDERQKVTYAIENLKYVIGNLKDRYLEVCNEETDPQLAIKVLQKGIRDLKKYLHDALEVSKDDQVTAHRIRRQCGAVINQLEKIVTAEVENKRQELDLTGILEKIENFAKGIVPQKRFRLPQFARKGVAALEKRLVKSHVKKYVTPAVDLLVSPAHMENLFLKAIAPQLGTVIGG